MLGLRLAHWLWQRLGYTADARGVLGSALIAFTVGGDPPDRRSALGEQFLKMVVQLGTVHPGRRVAPRLRRPAARPGPRLEFYDRWLPGTMRRIDSMTRGCVPNCVMRRRW